MDKTIRYNKGRQGMLAMECCDDQLHFQSYPLQVQSGIDIAQSYHLQQNGDVSSTPQNTPEVPPATHSPDRADRIQMNQEGNDWSFPHVVGSNYQSKKRYQRIVDTDTASYMRWQSKAHVLAWLHSFDQQQALRPVFLDTETTGTQRFSEVIEVCIVDEHGHTLFYSLVNPTTEIEPMASAVHGLTHMHVENAPRYPEIHDAIIQYLSDHVVLAYCVSFDIRLLRQTAECYGLIFPKLHTGCLMYAYAKYRDVYVPQSNGLRCKIHCLEEAARNEYLDLVPQHRAEQDAQCVYQLFQVMKRKYE